MKKHNALKVSLITLFVFVLLTWILPAATYQSSYSEIGRSQVGIFDLVSYQNTKNARTEMELAVRKVK